MHGRWLLLLFLFTLHRADRRWRQQPAVDDLLAFYWENPLGRSRAGCCWSTTRRCSTSCRCTSCSWLEPALLLVHGVRHGWALILIAQHLALGGRAVRHRQCGLRGPARALRKSQLPPRADRQLFARGLAVPVGAWPLDGRDQGRYRARRTWQRRAASRMDGAVAAAVALTGYRLAARCRPGAFR